MIQVQCAKCRFVFDTKFGIWCPRCRTEAVKKAFAPIDPLRTALGIPGSFTVNKHGEIVGFDEYYQGRPEEASIEADPADLRMPKGDSAQIYELKRRFRL